MNKPLNILIVEDSEDDALLLLRELRRGGYEPAYVRVETAEAMQVALAQSQWDIVIADFTMPHFSAPAALALLKESGLDLPFIIVSGTVGEAAAVAAMKAGAHDYLIRGNLARLIPAIERELREAESRRQRWQAERALFDRERLFRALIENAADAVSLIDATGLLSYTSPAIRRVLGYTPDEYTGRNAFDFAHPDDLADNTALFQQLLHNPHQAVAGQIRYRHKDGSWRWLEVVGTNLLAEPGVQAIVVNYHDITERRQAEEEIRRRNRELTLLNEVIAALAAGSDAETVLDIACRELALVFDLPQATAALLSEDKTTATVVVEYRAEELHQISPQGSVLNKTFPVAASPIIQHLLIHKTPLIIANAPTDPRLARFKLCCASAASSPCLCCRCSSRARWWAP